MIPRREHVAALRALAVPGRPRPHVGRYDDAFEPIRRVRVLAAGEGYGDLDAAALNTELKDFHAALGELSKGEKSALALKDKVARPTAAAE
jgi:phage-related protein